VTKNNKLIWIAPCFKITGGFSTSSAEPVIKKAHYE
jgi:hypothetical protein